LKTKLFFLLVLIIGAIIAIAVTFAENEELTENLPVSVKQTVQEMSKAVYSAWLNAPTPSAENTIKLPPPPPPIDPDFLALRDNLQREINAACCDIAVSVTDLQTGQAIDIQGDQPRLPGCTMNFFVLLSVVMDLQNGLYPESEVGSLISRTIWSSNPVTARELLIKTGDGNLYQGIDKVNELLSELGLHSALFDHPPAYPHESRFGRDSNIITSNQTNQALARLWRDFLSPQWRDYFLEKLTGVKPGLNYLIPAGVGQAEVSHKNGFFWDITGWVDNDIGIVVFERNGRQYAYAISLYMEEIPSKYADIPIGQKISRLVWEYFDNKYK
jgi:hypothetical protein